MVRTLLSLLGTLWSSSGTTPFALGNPKGPRWPSSANSWPGGSSSWGREPPHRTASKSLKEDGDSLDFVIESVEKEYAHLDEQVREIDRKISVHMDRHEGLKKDKELLTSIPGIGTTTAASWLAHLGDLSQFDRPSQIVAHIGIAPRERQSGSSVRGRPQICRTGIKELRKALYLPVVVIPSAAIRS